MKVARIEALADGIFAIAMTLLVLDLHVPTILSELNLQLIHLLLNFLALTISFIILGIYWVGHHFLLARLKLVDLRFTWWNIVFLLSFSIVPFTTFLLGKYPLITIAQIIYALNLACCGILLFCCVSQALVQSTFFENKPTVEFKRNIATKVLLPSFVYILSALASLASPYLGMMFLVVAPLISFVPIESKSWQFLLKPTDWAYHILTFGK